MPGGVHWKCALGEADSVARSLGEKGAAATSLLIFFLYRGLHRYGPILEVVVSCRWLGEGSCLKILCWCVSSAEEGKKKRL